MGVRGYRCVLHLPRGSSVHEAVPEFVDLLARVQGAVPRAWLLWRWTLQSGAGIRVHRFEVQGFPRRGHAEALALSSGTRDADRASIQQAQTQRTWCGGLFRPRALSGTGRACNGGVRAKCGVDLRVFLFPILLLPGAQKLHSLQRSTAAGGTFMSSG